LLLSFFHIRFLESCFPGKRLFRVFAFFLLYYNCNIIAPRARACGAFCRHICAISPDHIRRASLALSPPLRVSASRAFFARFARGMVNRDGRLPAAVSAYHAAPLAASRRPVAPPEYYHFYKILPHQFNNTRLAPRTLSHSRGEHCIH